MRQIRTVAAAVAFAALIASCSEPAPALIREIDLVPPARLADTLKPVAGWRLGTVESRKLSGSTRAETVYYNGPAIIVVEVIDSGELARSFASQHKSETSVEKWNETAKEGVVTLLVGNRFVVSLTGRGINEIGVLRDFVSKFDTIQLANLRKYRGT